MPTMFALAVVGNTDPDDPNPTAWSKLSDANLYCQSCRFRINARRAIGAILVLAVPFLVVFLYCWLIR